MDRFSEINSDLLRGGKPSMEDLKTLRNIWGVNRIVSLDKKIGLTISPICKDLGLEHIIIPLGDEGTEEAIEYLDKNIISLLSGKKPTFVHCRHGRDRTGLAIALYRIKKDNWSPEEAYQEALSLDFGDGLSKDMLDIFEKAIFKHKNNNNEFKPIKKDISDLARDNFNPDPQITENYFSPINPGDMQLAKDRKARKRKLRKVIYQDVNEAMAEIGQINNWNPIMHGISRDYAPNPVFPYGYSYIL